MYSTEPLVIRVVQVPQIPERQPKTGANPAASASSSRVPLSRDHAAVTADLAKRTDTPPSPREGVRSGGSALASGFSAVPEPNELVMDALVAHADAA